MDVPCNLFTLPVVIICQPDGEAESEGKGGFDQMGLELSTGSRSSNFDSRIESVMMEHDSIHDYCLFRVMLSQEVNSCDITRWEGMYRTPCEQ